MAVFSNSGVIAHNKPASKTSVTAGERTSVRNGASQSALDSRFSQYAPVKIRPTPNKPNGEGISPRKTAAINTVKTGLKISNCVTNETSAIFNARVEAICAMAFNPADPVTLNAKSQSVSGNFDVSTSAKRSEEHTSELQSPTN